MTRFPRKYRLAEHATAFDWIRREARSVRLNESGLERAWSRKRRIVWKAKAAAVISQRSKRPGSYARRTGCGINTQTGMLIPRRTNDEIACYRTSRWSSRIIEICTRNRRPNEADGEQSRPADFVFSRFGRIIDSSMYKRTEWSSFALCGPVLCADRVPLCPTFDPLTAVSYRRRQSSLRINKNAARESTTTLSLRTRQLVFGVEHRSPPNVTTRRHETSQLRVSRCPKPVEIENQRSLAGPHSLSKVSSIRGTCPRAPIDPANSTGFPLLGLRRRRKPQC